MDPVERELQWWAAGGYPEVVRQLQRLGHSCTATQVRHIINAQIKRRYQATGDPLWKPVGHAGRERLRRAIRENRSLDHQLQ